jgi:hypothetical protein
VRGFLIKQVFMIMNKRMHYADLIKKLISCENRVQLSDVVKEINEFNKNYFITQNSEEFKKFETLLGLMKIKLRHKHGITESKNYLISENQFKLIVETDRHFNIVAKYLDTQDWKPWDIGDGEFDVADGDFGRNLLRFRIQWSSTMPDLSFNVLYIEDSLVSKIMNMFNMTANQSVLSILNWFNKKYDYNLTINDYESANSNDAWDEEDNYYED